MKNNKKYYFGLLFLIILIGITLINISYSKFLYNGNLSGVATVPSKTEDIVITDVSFLSGNNVYERYSTINSFNKTDLNSNIILRNYSDSSITFQVTVTNRDEKIKYYKGTEFISSDNPDIIFEIDGISIGDSVAFEEIKTFNITFKYAEVKNNYDDTVLGSVIRFNFDDEQIKNYEELVFDGSNYIDTGVYLFSEENIGKNFEISFDIIDASNNQTNQASLLNSMLEVNPYPGFVLRYSNGSYEFNSPKIRTIGGINLANAKKVKLSRKNDVYYMQVDDAEVVTIGTNTSDTTFDVPLTFGASLDNNGNPWRYFVGTLANIKVTLAEPERYTIHFDANVGTGTMSDLIIRRDEEIELPINDFENIGNMFIEWNTAPDGSGVSYSEGEIISNMTESGSTITLYAIWKDSISYTVHFNANGGTGTMEDQTFRYDLAANLNINTFTKNNRTFAKWNTRADGNGIDYEDGELVKKLASEDNQVVELYAMWAEEYYSNPNEVLFRGNNNINTNLYLFNSANINKNFEIYFEIVNRNSTGNLSTIVNAMDETASPWPGVVYRVQSNTEDGFAANANDTDKIEVKYNRNNVSTVAIKRKDHKIYININKTKDEYMVDMTNILGTFDIPVTFGSSLTGNGNPQRYFNGTLKDMKVIIYE